MEAGKRVETVRFEYSDASDSDQPGLPTAAAARPAKQGLALAYELASQRLSGIGSFQSALNEASSQFPIAPVATGDQPVQWAKFTLNQAGHQIDGIRFTSPLEAPGDLLWAFAYSRPTEIVRWSITPSIGVVRGFRNYERKNDLDLSDTQLPGPAEVILQELTGGEIKPQREYYLWFSFREPGPWELYVKLKLIPSIPVAPESERYRSATALATHLDIGLPPDPPPGDAIVSYALDVWDVRGMDAAIGLLEERIRSEGGNASRRVRYYHIVLRHERAAAWARDSATRDEAYRQFQQVAASMRAFQQKVGSLRLDERRTLGAILYHEACVWLSAGQTDKANDIVREAIENGIDPRRDFPQDRIGEELRNSPGFKGILHNLNDR
jgi:hypothetical protein